MLQCMELGDMIYLVRISLSLLYKHLGKKSFYHRSVSKGIIIVSGSCLLCVFSFVG